MADASKADDRAAELLADIATQAKAGDLGGFSNTITKCLAPPKVLHEVAAAPTFWNSAEALFRGVKDNDHAVTLALAEMGRLRASLKSKSALLRPMAAELLARRVPRHFCHGDADLTAFAAKGWECSALPVDLAVAVRTVVLAEAPKPLAPWLELALAGDDVAAVIKSIAECLREAAGTDAQQSSRRAGRLQRVLRALRSASDSDDVAQGDGAAGAVADLVASAYRGMRPPPYAAAAKAVDELMGLALHLIRMDLQLLTATAIYDSVGKATGWLPEGGWRRFTRSSPSAVRLRKTLLDGLIILLKQRNPSQALLDCHRALSPDRQAALAELGAAAQVDREIPDQERAWLASGGSTAVDVEERDLTETDDTAVGMALLAAEAMARCGLFADAPAADAPVQELVDRAREARERVLSLARRRELRTFGTPGERVRFSPAAHRLAEAGMASGDVVVVEPGVESQGAFGARVVVPALVENARS